MVSSLWEDSLESYSKVCRGHLTLEQQYQQLFTLGHTMNTVKTRDTNAY